MASNERFPLKVNSSTQARTATFEHFSESIQTNEKKLCPKELDYFLTMIKANNGEELRVKRCKGKAEKKSETRPFLMNSFKLVEDTR